MAGETNIFFFRNFYSLALIFAFIVSYNTDIYKKLENILFLMFALYFLLSASTMIIAENPYFKQRYFQLMWNYKIMAQKIGYACSSFQWYWALPFRSTDLIGDLGMSGWISLICFPLS